MTTLSSITSIKDALKREQRHVEGMISEMQGEIGHLTESKTRLEQQIASWEIKIADLNQRLSLLKADLGKL